MVIAAWFNDKMREREVKKVHGKLDKAGTCLHHDEKQTRVYHVPA